MINLKELKKHLNTGWARVEFTKVDGKRRNMLCTRKPPKSSRKKKIVDRYKNVMVVFDGEKKDWRSIRLNSIKRWKAEKETKNG